MLRRVLDTGLHYSREVLLFAVGEPGLKVEVEMNESVVACVGKLL